MIVNPVADNQDCVSVRATNQSDTMFHATVASLGQNNAIVATRDAQIDVRPYASYDLFWLETTMPQGWFSVSSLRSLVNPELSVSFMEQDHYLGSAGLFQLWPGVYEAWLVLLTNPRDAWGFIRAVRRSLQVGMRLTQAHRIQAYCLAEFRQGHILAARVGLEREAVLRSATPTKTDLWVYAKVRP